MARPKIRKSIHQSKELLKELMVEHITGMAESMISTIMKNYRNSTPSNQVNAAKGVGVKGFNDYKSSLKELVGAISDTALEEARKELPEKVSMSGEKGEYKFSKFDDLPPALKKKLAAQLETLTESQRADIEKYISLQFSSSVGSTDSANLIEEDLFEKAEWYIQGSSVDAAAGVTAGRTVNETRRAFMNEPEALEQVEALQFVNDVPETDICDDLNGTIFYPDDPGYDRYLPPLHYNCDSYILPILVGKLGNREVSKLEPSKSEYQEDIQFSARKCCSCKRTINIK